MDAEKFNADLMNKAAELKEPCDIPAVDKTPAELNLDLLAVTMAAIEHGDRLARLERFRIALERLLGFAIALCIAATIIRLTQGVGDDN